tara:strand:+ start:255 stop:446 length:192 start_codon:yes stop_codon:yes gene_type:complete
MGGNMDELSFEEFSERMRERMQESIIEARRKRDAQALTLPDILHSDEYRQHLEIEFIFTDRVN